MCLTNLTAFCDGTTGCVDKGSAVHAVHLEFRKVFDMVFHDIFVAKLGRCGMEEQAMEGVGNELEAAWLKGWRTVVQS